MKQDSNNLNLLRAFAVVLVFVSHVLQYLSPHQALSISLGHAGVLFFFVHTALVLMRSLERQEKDRLWARFVVRRIFRIYPLAILAVLLYSGLRIGSVAGYHKFWVLSAISIQSILPNLALVQNITLTQSIPAPLWSLPFEFQMYLVLPFVFLVFRGKGAIDAISIWIIAAAGSLALMTLGSSEYGGLFQFIPCFLAGAVAYVIGCRQFLPSWLLVPGLVILTFLYSTANFVAVEWPICLALGIMLPYLREVPDGYLSAICAMLAKYSFGIYLFHNAFLFVFLKQFGYVGSIAAFAMTILASAAVFHVIEQPMIKLGRKLAEIDFELKVPGRRACVSGTAPEKLTTQGVATKFLKSA